MSKKKRVVPKFYYIEQDAAGLWLAHYIPKGVLWRRSIHQTKEAAIKGCWEDNRVNVELQDVR